MLKNRLKKTGLPAGTLPKHTDSSATVAKISVFQYNKETLVEKEVTSLEEIEFSSDCITWVSVEGAYNSRILEEAGRVLGLHPLMLEDIATLDQRPKIDEYEQNLFLTFKKLAYDDTVENIGSEQLSFVLGKNYLLTFQENPGGLFNSNRERIREGKGRIKQLGADYLMYSLIDMVVDHYYIVLEKLGEKIETLEIDLIEKPHKEDVKKLYKLKNDTLFLKKFVWPLRDMLNKLIRDENSFIANETGVFFKDVYDHCVHVIETIGSYRELLTSMMDLYLNSVSNRMNEVMKVLTVISTIFIPLTFLTGIYGMNFEHMPELHYKYAYPSLIFLMFLIIALQLYYFRKKKWI